MHASAIRILTLAFLVGYPSVALCQDTEKPADAQPNQALAELIDRLSGKSFRERESAEQALWEIGPSIEEALIKREKVADLETRSRIARIRKKFALGLTPDLPKDLIQSVITLNETTDTRQQTAAAQNLLQKGRVDLVANFIKRKPNNGRQLLGLVGHALRALPPDAPISKVTDDFHIQVLELALVEATQNLALIHQIFNSNYFRRHEDDAWLKRILKLLESCPDQHRYTVAGSMQLNPKLSKRLASADFVHQWIETAAREPSSTQRLRLIARFCNLQHFGAPERLAQRKPPIQPLDATKTIKKLSDAAKVAFLEFCLADPNVVEKLHTDLREDGLVKICQTKLDSRYIVLGQLTAHPKWSDAKHSIPNLVDRAKEPAEKENLIRGFTQGITRYGDNLKKEQVDAIWKKIAVGAPEQWQLRPLLNIYAGPNSLQQRLSKDTLERVLVLAENADAEDTTQLISNLSYRKRFLNDLIEQNFQIRLLKTLRGNSKTTRTVNFLGTVLRNGVFTSSFDDKEKRQKLLDFCLEDESKESRYDIANSVVSNLTLLPALINDGHFLTITDSLIVGRNGKDRYYADLMGRFFASRPVTNHLVQTNSVKVLISLKDRDLPAPVIDQILTKIATSDNTISAIFDDGSWAEVNKLFDSISDVNARNTAKQNLLGRKAFADHIADQKQVVQTLKQLSKDKTWLDRKMYLALIRNLPADVAESESTLDDEFLAFAKTLVGSRRKTCFTTLASSTWFLNCILTNNRWDDFAKTFAKEVNETEFASFLRSRASSKEIIDEIAAGHLNTQLLLGNFLKNDEARATYYQQIGSSYHLANWLKVGEQPELLIKSLKSVRDQSARDMFAFACFWQRGLRDIADAENCAEEIVDFALDQPDQSATLLAIALLSRGDNVGDRIQEMDLSDCFRGDITKAISIACNDLAWRRGSSQWTRLFAGIKASYVKDKPEFAAEISKFAFERDKIHHAKIAQALLQTSWFVPQLRASKKTASFVKGFGEKLSDWDRRTCVALYAQSPAIVQELESGSLQFFVALCDSMNPKDANRYIGFSSGYTNLQAWFATSRQPEKIIAALDSIKDPKRRETFASKFLTPALLGSQPNNKELIPKIIAYSKDFSEDFQVQLAVSLVSSYHTDDQAMQTKLPEFLVDRLGHKNLSGKFLATMIRSTNINGLIAKKNLEQKVIDLAFAVKDPDDRYDCFYALLGSKELQTRLTDDQINTIFSLTQQQDQKKLVSLIQKRPYLVQRMIELGNYSIVHRLATIGDKATSSNSRWALYLNPAVVAEERKKKRSPATLVSLLRDRNPRIAESRLMDLARNPEATYWIFDSYGWKPFADTIQKLDEPKRRYLLSSFFRGSKLFSHLAQSEKFEELIQQEDLKNFIVYEGGYVYLLQTSEAMKTIDPKKYMKLVREGFEKSGSLHQQSAHAALRTTSVREAALRTGNGAWVVKVLRDNPPRVSPKKQIEYRRREITDSRGLLALAIRARDFDTAEQMLSEFVDDDRGRMRLVRFQMHRQLAEQAAGKTFKPSDAFIDMLKKDARLSSYWSRSQGDFQTAIAKAKEVGDAGLIWSLTLESRDWAALKKLPVCKTAELPMYRKNLKINPTHRRIEQLGILAALSQLSGQLDVSTQQLGSWVSQNKNSPQTARYGADALLSVGQIDSAFELLDITLPRRAFYLYRYRLDYAKALEVIEWDSGDAQGYFDRLAGPVGGGYVDGSGAAAYLIQVALALRDAGRDEEIKPLIKALFANAGNAALSKEAREKYLRETAAKLHFHGFISESFDLVDLAKDDGTVKLFLNQAYDDKQFPGTAAEANVWLQEFAQRYQQETRKQLLTRVHGVMTASTPLDQVRPFPDESPTTAGNAAARTRFRYGLYDQAIAAAEKSTVGTRFGQIVAGHSHLAKKEYQEAADAFYEAFINFPSDLTRLYLAGHCTSLAGDVARGRELKLQARMLAVSFELNFGLAIGLENQGLIDDATEVNRTLVGNAPPASTAYTQALRRVALAEKDPAKASEIWNELQVYYLRPIRYYFDLDVWQQCEFYRRVASASVACQQGKFDAARKHWNNAIKIDPANVIATKKFAELLQTKNQNEFAAKVLSEQKQYLENQQKRFPNSPVIKERLAKAN